MRFFTSRNAGTSARIASPGDPVRASLWAAAAILVAVSAWLRPGAVPPVARATLGPFATLAAIIVAAALAGRLGVFALLARALIPRRPPGTAAVAAVLAFTALQSALVNLDVAVVVATPVALRAAQRHRLAGGQLAAAVAITANATSFLLPTSNITNLLLLGRVPLPTPAYLSDSWLAWLLVTAVTLGLLSLWAVRTEAEPGRPVQAGPSARAVLDLVPMFLAASAIRALTGTALALHGSFTGQLAAGSALAAAASNLPAAAAIQPAGTAGLWAAILATTIGPNLLITGSVATLICRRIARDGGARLGILQFSATGAALLPAQLAAATLGLHLAGALR
jgi:arsenical pump membrane protein